MKHLLVCILFALSACAGQKIMVIANEGQPLNVKASSFKFEPNDIKVKKGESIVLRLENVSKSAHNFTVVDSQGNKIKETDLLPAQTVEVQLTLSSPGIYHFYCDKDSHQALGMKGQIEVE